MSAQGGKTSGSTRVYGARQSAPAITTDYYGEALCSRIRASALLPEACEKALSGALQKFGVVQMEVNTEGETTFNPDQHEVRADLHAARRGYIRETEQPYIPLHTLNNFKTLHGLLNASRSSWISQSPWPCI